MTGNLRTTPVLVVLCLVPRPRSPLPTVHNRLQMSNFCKQLCSLSSFIPDCTEIGLSLLKEFVAFDALHDSSAQDPKCRCHPSTRESVLRTVRKWIDNPDAKDIAQSISHSYERNQVVATFFIFRSDPNHNDGNRLFPTVAWQLAFSITCAKSPIALAPTENPDLSGKAIEIQFHHKLQACNGDSLIP